MNYRFIFKLGLNLPTAYAKNMTNLQNNIGLIGLLK